MTSWEEGIQVENKKKQKRRRKQSASLPLPASPWPASGKFFAFPPFLHYNSLATVAVNYNSLVTATVNYNSFGFVAGVR
jgi:hypothetical protein